VNGEPSAGARGYIDRLIAVAILGGSPVCIDSAPLIDFAARNEPTSSLLRPLLRHHYAPIVISTITLAEVIARPTAEGNSRGVTDIHQTLLALPNMLIVDLDQQHALETAVVRADTGLKLPDAAIVATARLAGAGALIGNDRQWRGKQLGVPYHHVDDILALP
jgi:predicted nucleic acid-binding protein